MEILKSGLSAEIKRVQQVIKTKEAEEVEANERLLQMQLSGKRKEIKKQEIILEYLKSLEGVQK